MNYSLENNVATLSFDDGKANVVGIRFLDDITAGLDQAESEGAVAVILRGREGMFSAGFDLEEFKKGPEAGLLMARRGFELLLRLYSFPLPLVAACTGHSIAMGAFITMACDYRVGTSGAFKFRLPETAIGMDLPPVLLSLTVARISKRHLERVALLSETYNPDQAVDAGFLDEAVEPGELEARCTEIAQQLAQLPQAQFAKNKLATRADTLKIMTQNIQQFL